MASKRRTHRIEKLARIYDDEILPIWSERFGRLLLRDLKIPERGQILDVGCGTGYPATELVQRMGEGCRLIAIDAYSAMLDVARKKLEKLGSKDVFVRSESAEPKLSFAADVYDLVVSNLGLMELADPAAALVDFTRVTKPGGEVRVTLPAAGSFAEFYDIYAEVLVKHDKQETLGRLELHRETNHPSLEVCEEWLRGAGLQDVSVETEEFTLLFKSSREFFFAPIIEFGPLADWKAVAGTGQEMQDVFWYIKEAIDAYFEGRAFQITIKAACLRGTKPLHASEPVGVPASVDEITGVAQKDAVLEDAVMQLDMSDFEDDDASMDSLSTVETAVSDAASTADLGAKTDESEDVPDPDTLDRDTEDFPGTLEGLPYIRPLGDDIEPEPGTGEK